MHPRIPTLALLLALTAALHASLDLTPSPGIRPLEGFSVPVVYFRAGAGKVCLQPPHGWKVVGAKSQATLLPPGDGRAEARLDVLDPGAVRAAPALPGETATEAEKTPFQAWVAARLPVAAENVALVAQAADELPLEGGSSRELQWECNLGGQRQRVSITAVDLPSGERLLLTVVAREAAYEALRREFHACLASWQRE